MGIKERKEREKESRREEIINAAEKIFFQKGLPQATMDEIAEAAELSKGTLYLYYKSKEDLYLAVSMRGMDLLLSLFEKATTTGEPVLKLVLNLLDAYYAYFSLHREYFRMFYFYESPQFHSQATPEMLEVCQKHDERIWAYAIRTLRQAVDEGMLHADLDPKGAAIMLWSNAYGLMRLIDRSDNYWRTVMNIDLESTLRQSTAMLIEAMMTKRAKRLYPNLLVHEEHRKAQEGTGGAGGAGPLAAEDR